MKIILALSFAAALLGSAAAQNAVNPVPSGPPAPATMQTNSAAVDLIPDVPETYTVGVGDLLHVAVFNHPELSSFVRVDTRGDIRTRYGRTLIPASGHTAAQLEISVARGLEQDQLVPAARVEVIVAQVRSKPIVVMGAVQRPTTLEAVRPMSLMEVLASAGGLTEKAGSSILITRGQGEARATEQLSVRQLLDKPASSPELVGGEQVTVLPGGQVYVVGAVTTPGGFPVNQGEPVSALQAVALAKGWTPTANEGQADIVRQVDGKMVRLPVNLDQVLQHKAPDPVLQADDILYVPDNSTKKVLLSMMDHAASALTYAAGLLIGTPH